MIQVPMLQPRTNRLPAVRGRRNSLPPPSTAYYQPWPQEKQSSAARPSYAFSPCRAGHAAGSLPVCDTRYNVSAPAHFQKTMVTTDAPGLGLPKALTGPTVSPPNTQVGVCAPPLP